jgi:hypothetical protein
MLTASPLTHLEKLVLWLRGFDAALALAARRHTGSVSVLLYQKGQSSGRCLALIDGALGKATMGSGTDFWRVM